MYPTTDESLKQTLQHVEGLLKYWLFPVRKRMFPRHFHAYCVGSVKSGTHSIAGLFSRHYRARHEPESALVIDMILAAAHDDMSEQEKRERIKTRDRRLWLELEASHLYVYLLEMLVEEFPQTKFILTIRDCYSWLASYLNQQLARTIGPHWHRLNAWRYAPEQLVYAPQEQILREHGLYTLDSYLSLWAAQNTKVLTIVPPERLLIIRTHEISRAIPRLASFLNIHQESLEPSQSHLYKAQKQFNLLSQIDKEFLEDKFQKHCQTLMEQFFPEIHPKVCTS